MLYSPIKKKNHFSFPRRKLLKIFSTLGLASYFSKFETILLAAGAAPLPNEVPVPTGFLKDGALDESILIDASKYRETLRNTCGGNIDLAIRQAKAIEKKWKENHADLSGIPGHNIVWKEIVKQLIAGTKQMADSAKEKTNSLAMMVKNPVGIIVRPTSWGIIYYNVTRTLAFGGEVAMNAVKKAFTVPEEGIKNDAADSIIKDVEMYTFGYGISCSKNHGCISTQGYFAVIGFPTMAPMTPQEIKDWKTTNKIKTRKIYVLVEMIVPTAGFGRAQQEQIVISDDGIYKKIPDIRDSRFEFNPQKGWIEDRAEYSAHYQNYITSGPPKASNNDIKSILDHRIEKIPQLIRLRQEERALGTPIIVGQGGGVPTYMVWTEKDIMAKSVADVTDDVAAGNWNKIVSMAISRQEKRNQVDIKESTDMVKDMLPFWGAYREIFVNPHGDAVRGVLYLVLDLTMVASLGAIALKSAGNTTTRFITQIEKNVARGLVFSSAYNSLKMRYNGEPFDPKELAGLMDIVFLGIAYRSMKHVLNEEKNVLLKRSIALQEAMPETQLFLPKDGNLIKIHALNDELNIAYAIYNGLDHPMANPEFKAIVSQLSPAERAQRVLDLTSLIKTQFELNDLRDLWNVPLTELAKEAI